MSASNVITAQQAAASDRRVHTQIAAEIRADLSGESEEDIAAEIADAIADHNMIALWHNNYA